MIGSFRFSLVGASLIAACVTSPPARDPTPMQDAEPVARTAEPAPTPAPTKTEAPAIPRSDASPTGIPPCDEYLALYASCEEHLKPEIMAGDRRFHHAEQASLVYLSGTPEAATLPNTCRNLLDALRIDCPAPLE